MKDQLVEIFDEMNASLDKVSGAVGVVGTVKALDCLADDVRGWKARLLQLAVVTNSPPEREVGICDGTACVEAATKSVSIRVISPLGFVYRNYCDGCTEHARRHTMSEVVSVEAKDS